MEKESKEVETSSTTQGKFKAFFSRFGVLFGVAFGLLTIAMLFAPIVSYETRVIIDEVKHDTPYAVNLVDLYRGNYPFNWSMTLTLILLGLGVLLAGGAFLGKEVFHSDAVREHLSVAASLCFLVSFCFLTLTREFFSYNADAIENFHGVDLAIGGSFAIVFSVIAAFSCAIVTFQNREIKVSEIAEDGILIALSFGLNFVKIPLGATGGSINFQMLPLMMIALRRGPASGLICGGLLYGLLTCLTDGYGFATYPFDYLIGFGSVAVLGFIRPLALSRGQIEQPNQVKGLVIGEVSLLIAGILATFIRFAGSTASSMVVYGYDLASAAAYNAVYIPVSGACALIPLMLLYPALLRLEKQFPTRNR